jgi:hypothetical protein
MSTTNGTLTDTPTTEGVIKLRRLERAIYEVPITGTSPLIANRWTEKARQMMLDAQQTKARAKKDPKDPVANFEAARYRFPDGRDGFPATAFKAAIVDAGRYFEGITMTDLRRMIYVEGEIAGQDALVPLTFDTVTMREDTPRNANGVADLRYRPQYWPWSATLRISTIAGQFDVDSLYALVDAAGLGGVGEWRPSAPKSKTGTYGTFEVAG